MLLALQILTVLNSCLFLGELKHLGYIWEQNGGLPDYVENGRQQQLVVNGDGHVPRLVESRRHGSHGITKVHGPQQEEELRCSRKKCC